ncbi:MAG: EAL domain-containing protein, partial [Clostridiales bacterium]|nr:EAL domain-containing protein [Clostridiales bacterium]
KDFALNITGTFIIKVSLDNKIIDVNEPFLKYTNYEKGDIVDKVFFSSLVTKYSGIDYKTFLTKLYSKGVSEADIGIVTKDKKEIFMSVFAKSCKNENGILYYVFVCKDISEFYHEEKYSSSINEGRMIFKGLAESESVLDKNFSMFNGVERLKESENKHKFLIDSMNIGMLDFDVKKNKFYFSDKCKQLLCKDAHANNRDIKNILITRMYKEDYYKVLKNVHLAVSNKLDSFKSSFRLVNDDKSYTYIEFFGKLTYNREGEIINLAGSLTDISSACIYQEKIKKLAYYDNLTGLDNRTYMEEYVDMLYKNNPYSRSAFIFLDIDDFKFINDSFGHYFGDKVICEMAVRIRSISKNYIVSRFSGDEIAIFIPEYGTLEGLINYIELLSTTLSISYDDEKDVSYSVEASIGISVSPDNGKDFEDLLKCADIAMNRVKNMGKNKYLFFDKKMQEDLKEQLEIEKDLKNAVGANGELLLYLQPQYDINTGRLSGFESLTRWSSPKRGMVPPSVFIPIAEETRLIVPLGRWVLLESCRLLKELQGRGYKDIKISVNLSPIQLIDNHLIEYVKEILFETEIDTGMLELEITETALMENFELNLKKLYELKDMGISMALDDFGTGYSSLTYLKTLPMSSIKIDKSFIDNVSTSNIDKRITEKIIELSHVLNFKTIAEGVETKEQLQFVKSMGCDIVQGFFSGMPIYKDDVFKALGNNLYSYFNTAARELSFPNK